MISTCISVAAGRTRRVVAIAGAFALVFTTLALAHEGAMGVVKKRMDRMDRQKDDMKVIGDMAKGVTPFDAAKAAAAARDISVTSKRIPELFPEGSEGGESDALPAIWKEWGRFTKSAEDLDRVARDLTAALEASSAEWKGAFKAVADACKTCHQDFRAKKN